MARVATVRIVDGKAVTGREADRGVPYIVARSGRRGKKKVLRREGASPEALERERAEIEGTLTREAAGGLTFASAAALYVAEGMGRLSASTATKRRSLLEGPLGAAFGPLALRRIRRADLVAWYGRELGRERQRGRGRAATTASAKTLANHLDAVAAVFWFAIDRELDPALTESPVEPFRASLRRGKGKHERAGEDPARDVRAIEDPAAREALVSAARADTPETHLAALLALDAGLRAGEVAGLRWQDVWTGGGPDDTSRHLRVTNTRPTGGDGDEPPKSGRDRRVAMSRRLRLALLEHHARSGRPAEGYVLRDPAHRTQPFESAVFGARLEALCKAAKLGRWRPKDLRSTYASVLLTAGIPLKWISRQLGHSTTALTERRYARWIGDGEYREPERLRPGELPPDLLSSAHEAHSAAKPQGGEA